MRKTFLAWLFSKQSCYICDGEIPSDWGHCEICLRDYCDKCSAVYNVITQIDYNCCKECSDNIEDI